MIRYALLCEHEHEFDGWFGSSTAFDEQASASEIACPVCGSVSVRKALMAPNVSGTKKSTTIDVPSQQAQAAQKMVTMMTALRKHVEENCDYVGDKFAETARRIHYEEEPQREIYGEATLEEASALIEEGVEVAPLPGLTPRQAN
ncbi:MAG: DUF1178 family protein [Parvibaculum sp.]|uniref:DUF1178 family protein n=1 Tax=Parvibaculum sp. TaxID=2024848 RepID=UPI0025E9FCE3|nr:DUF1178 family protein [Parvibaculum sp.]MCE9651345.1 DUF1178 family protein [Parvibaculum sp.]